MPWTRTRWPTGSTSASTSRRKPSTTTTSLWKTTAVGVQPAACNSRPPVRRANGCHSITLWVTSKHHDSNINCSPDWSWHPNSSAVTDGLSWYPKRAFNLPCCVFSTSDIFHRICKGHTYLFVGPHRWCLSWGSNITMPFNPIGCPIFPEPWERRSRANHMSATGTVSSPSYSLKEVMDESHVFLRVLPLPCRQWHLGERYRLFDTSKLLAWWQVQCTLWNWSLIRVHHWVDDMDKALQDSFCKDDICHYRTWCFCPKLTFLSIVFKQIKLKCLGQLHARAAFDTISCLQDCALGHYSVLWESLLCINLWLDRNEL